MHFDVIDLSRLFVRTDNHILPVEYSYIFLTVEDVGMSEFKFSLLVLLLVAEGKPYD